MNESTPLDQEKTRPVSEWLISAFILAAFSSFTPVMLLAVNTQRGAKPDKFLLVAFGAFVAATLAASVLARWVGHRRGVAVAAVLLLVFFTWREVQESARGADFMQPALNVILPLLLLGGLLALAFRFGETREFRLVLVVAGAALVLTPLWALVPWYANNRPEVRVSTVVAANETADRPDLIFVVLDGYGRADILNEMYGYSNDAFLDALRAQGFSIPNSSRANYHMTAASLSSTLALEYLVPEPVVPDHPLRVELYEVIQGANPVVEALREAGYQYVHIESGWDGSRCGDNVDLCYRSGFIDEASWALLARMPFFPSLRESYGDAFILNGLRAFDDLTEELSRQTDQPRFVFAHIPLPHPPLYLTEDCEVRPEPQPGGGAVGARYLIGTPELNRRMDAYIEQIGCVNQKVLRFLDDLGDDTLVFITADHGPDSLGQVSVPPEDWTAEDVRERFAVLSAYRLLPECEEELADDVDLINGMRVVINCVLGSELPSLPYQAFIFPTPDGDPYPTTEVDIELIGG